MKKIFGLVIVLITWWAASLVSIPLFVPSPMDVFHAFVGLAEGGQLQQGLVYSFTRITAAALISICIALPLALLIYWSKTIRDMFMPFVSMLRFLPVTAFSPLLILWFGIDEKMKISFLCLASFVYLLPSILLCFDDVPTDLIDTGATLDMSKPEVILHILFPAAAPSVFNSFLMMYGIGWTYVAVIEAVNAKYGLGFIINTASARGKTAIVFAAIITIMLFSFLFDTVGKWIIKKVFRWRYLNDCIE